MKRFVIGADGTGVAECISGLEKYERELEAKAKILLSRLADEGYAIARTGFEQAVYDGSNDVGVRVETRGDRARAIVAFGSTALFIEFGTGVTYADTHPEAAQNGMIRGSYGLGHGKQKTWGYYGEPGTNGVVAKETSKGTLILTHGNPANMPMYEAAKQLRERLPAIVREVFGRD